MNVVLFAGFCAVAVISAFIGLGGGTYYLLLLQLFAVSAFIIPLILVSGTSAVLRLFRGEFRAIDTLFVCVTAPAMVFAYIGGR